MAKLLLSFDNFMTNRVIALRILGQYENIQGKGQNTQRNITLLVGIFILGADLLL